jgi:NAD(P)-dependent dehydrogenase (short-subunit alcohol dehydrogenase family)
MSNQSGRSVVITGAGSGLGRDLALQLTAKGYVVFGTALAPAEVQDLGEASGGRVSLTVCDLTQAEAVKAWASSVSNSLGDAGLNLLINNAGILTPGPIEVLPLDAIRREFDVNVFGALSVSIRFCRHFARHAAVLSRSALGQPACRCHSTDRRAHRKPPWKSSRPCIARSSSPSGSTSLWLLPAT